MMISGFPGGHFLFTAGGTMEASEKITIEEQI